MKKSIHSHKTVIKTIFIRSIQKQIQSNHSFFAIFNVLQKQFNGLRKTGNDSG